MGGEPTPFLNSPFNEVAPVLSPDGRFMAYFSDESGRDEVYVRTFPDGEGKRIISRAGGREPMWSGDGRELFYRNGNNMMAVAVDADPAFSAETPRALFEDRYVVDPNGNPNHDISGHGERFLMVREGDETPENQFNVVLNWFEELIRLVPTDH